MAQPYPIWMSEVQLNFLHYYDFRFALKSSGTGIFYNGGKILRKAQECGANHLVPIQYLILWI